VVVLLQPVGPHQAGGVVLGVVEQTTDKRGIVSHGHVPGNRLHPRFIWGADGDSLYHAGKSIPQSQPRRSAAMRHYDIAVIGTGPSGQKAAIQAAKLGKRVVVIERNAVVGGAQINTGTIPSKALREAALHLTGSNKRGLFGESYRVKRNITVDDLITVSHQ